MNKIDPNYSSYSGANVEYEYCSETISICQLFKISITCYILFLCSYTILLYPSSIRRKCPLSMLEDVPLPEYLSIESPRYQYFPHSMNNWVFQIRFTFNTGHLGFTEMYSVAIIHVIRYRIAVPLAYWQNKLFLYMDRYSKCVFSYSKLIIFPDNTKKMPT